MEQESVSENVVEPEASESFEAIKDTSSHGESDVMEMSFFEDLKVGVP